MQCTKEYVNDPGPRQRRDIYIGGCTSTCVYVIHTGVRLLPNGQSFDWGSTQPDIAMATGRDRGGMVYNNGAIYDWQCFMPIPPS